MTIKHVRVGNGRLAVDVNGSGDPPVVFVSALGEAHAQWVKTREAMTVDTTTVTYGRPGLGGSPTRAGILHRSVTCRWAAEDLGAMLAAIGVRQPPVLVGHSIGGMIAERYVTEFGTVAGLVLVDPSDLSLFVDTAIPRTQMTDSNDDHTSFNIPISLEDWNRQEPPSQPRAVVVSSAVGRWQRIQDPGKYKPYTVDELDQRWQSYQRSLAERVGAQLVIAHTAGHRIDSEAPTLIAAVIDAVVQAARASSEVLLDLETLDRAGGYPASTA